MGLAPGTRLGPYEILSLLGAGGMGEVYRARDPRLGREVAIKVLPAHLAASPEALARFEREARVIAALSHPNILAIHDFGNEQGVAYAVMELLEGETLRGRLGEGRLPGPEAAKITTAVAEGLAAAHAKGIVHRDLKPENIFLTADGRVKILDFGLARRNEASGSDQTATEPGTVLGTVGYMSPEQVRGETAGAGSDIFSLGCVLYEMLAGRKPFGRASTAETMAAILREEPAPVSDAPAELQRVVAHCLAKQPEGRFHSAHDLALALRGTGETRAPARRLVRVGVVAAAVAVVLLTAVWWRGSRGARQDAIDSLVVLPFVNAAGTPVGTDVDFLADGITESIISGLSRLPRLRVVPRSTAFRYKGRDVDPQKIARDLKVRAVVTGRVVERGGTLAVSAELVDVEAESQLWGGQYNRKVSDLFAVQEEIARDIAERLRLRLSGEEEKRVTRRYTESTEAYQLYLQGRFYWNKRTPSGFQRALERFGQALEKDPGYAPAYSGLADTYNLQGWYGMVAPGECYPRAKAAVERALAIDDSMAEAHTSLGLYLHYYERDWEAAEREYRRAIELNPNYASGHQWYGNYFRTMGRLEEAQAKQRRALELDPLSLGIGVGGGWTSYLAQKYDQAIEQFRRTLELDPKFPLPRVWLGIAYSQKGMHREALAELERATEDSEGEPIGRATLAHALAVAGRTEEARKAFDELLRLRQKRYVSAYLLAVVQAGLGDKEKALEWLDRAFEERASWLVELVKVDPRLDRLRGEARFQDLLRRMKMSPATSR